MLGLAVGSVLFEQSPANEALRTALGLEVLQRTQSEWPVGAAILGLTFLIEGASSLLIIGGLHLPSELVAKFTDRFGRNGSDSVAPRRSLVGAVTDASLALGVGAGIVVMRHHLRDPDRPVRDDLRVAFTATTVVAVVSGAIGVLAAGGIRHAGKVGLETPAQWFVDYATDWRFWMVVFAIVQVLSQVRRLLGRRRSRPAPVRAPVVGAGGPEGWRA